MEVLQISILVLSLIILLVIVYSLFFKREKYQDELEDMLLELQRPLRLVKIDLDNVRNYYPKIKNNLDGFRRILNKINAYTHEILKLYANNRFNPDFNAEFRNIMREIKPKFDEFKSFVLEDEVLRDLNLPIIKKILNNIEYLSSY